VAAVKVFFSMVEGPSVLIFLPLDQRGFSLRFNGNYGIILLAVRQGFIKKAHKRFSSLSVCFRHHHHPTQVFCSRTQSCSLPFGYPLAKDSACNQFQFSLNSHDVASDSVLLFNREKLKNAC